ncbi:MAG TPA: hypothetical protein VMW27_17700 [Thermoanaerobaculia bacterium]|nr:hypothetical protein [Thermoanaerobaculia bacterium]
MTINQYIWELGIDFNAVETAGLHYLRQGFTSSSPEGAPGPMAPLMVSQDAQITFRIFDVTSSSSLTDSSNKRIKSFSIVTKPAVRQLDSSGETSDPFDSLQPVFPLEAPRTDLESTAFGGCFPSWSTGPVTVTTQGRYLVSFLVQAGSEEGSLVFAVDPEMEVGPNMIPAHGVGEEGARRTRSL